MPEAIVSVTAPTIDKAIANLRDKSEHQKLMNRWAAIYFRSAQARYQQLARGGWPALNKKTARRKGSDLILIETHALINAFGTVQAPGQIRQFGNTETELFAIFGVGGSEIHSRNSTFEEVATAHHFGLGSAYKRQKQPRPLPIIPNQKTLDRLEIITRGWTLKALRGKI